MAFPLLAAAAPVIAAGIGAAANYFGGKKAAESAEYQNAVNANLQREFAQSGIQWRVADAQKAGVHPLFALGASGASFSPGPIHVNDKGFGALGEMGQNVVRAYAANTASQEDKELRQAQIERERAAAAKDYAQAAMFDNERMRMYQAEQGAVTFPYPRVGGDTRGIIERELPAVGKGDVAKGFPGVPLHTLRGKGAGNVNPKAQDQFPSAPGDTALGAPINPYWEQYVVKNVPGRAPVPVVVPSTGGQGVGEALEQLSWSNGTMQQFLAENVRRFGVRWIYDFYLGEGPSMRGVPRRDLGGDKYRR